MSLEILSKEYADSTFASGPVVKTITSSDGSVSVFTDGPNVDLKVKAGGSSVDDNPRFRIITWTGSHPIMGNYGPQRPENATTDGYTLEGFNSDCGLYCVTAFAVALNEYTWLVTRGDASWNDGDFAKVCWNSLKNVKEGYQCHWCDLPESILPY